MAEADHRERWLTLGETALVILVRIPLNLGTESART